MNREALPQSEPVFRALIEQSNYAILLIRQDETLAYANPYLEELTGYRVEEMIGCNILRIVHPAERVVVSDALKNIREVAGKPIKREFRCQHKQGMWSWIEGTFSRYHGDEQEGSIIANYQDITERKRAEEGMQQRVEYYRTVVEQATEGIFMTDQLGRYKEVNIAGCAMTGYSREELQSKTIKDLSPDEDLPFIQRAVGELLEGITRRTNWTIKRKDGTLLPIELSARLLSNGDLLGIVRDISGPMKLENERLEFLKREQEAREEAENARTYLTTVFETITDGVLVCDKNGKILHTNAATRAYLGLLAKPGSSLSALESSLPSRLIPHNSQGEALPFESWPMTRVLRGERLAGHNTVDVLFFDQYGNSNLLNTSGDAIRDNQGQITGGVIVLRDVTKRRELEQKLQYSELKLRSLVESNILGVGVATAQGRILEVNDVLANMLGYTKDELLAEDFHWQRLTPIELRTLEIQGFEELVANGVLLPRERTYARKDGERFPALIAATMIEQERGIAMVVVLDVSDRKAAERRKQEFMSMVSHELRTPLTGIVGFIDLAQFLLRQLGENVPAEYAEQFEQIGWMLQQAEQHANVETRLVEALLDVARMERHIFKLSLKQWNLIEIVREVTIAQRQISTNRKIELVLPAQASVPVIIDADRIQQVITNYLTNALKFAPEEHEIIVGLQVGEAEARVYVSDQGPGLTALQQQQVWERFYQNDEAKRYGGERGGLGLGLYIARVLIEQHYGRVGVDSQPGEGATFWFTIPFVS